jgi:hypothetical protein
VGLFERLFAGRGDGRRKAAEAKELAGDLGAAVELYLEAELPDEAARVLLLRADSEQAPERRIAFCATAARTAASEELRRAALRRKALLSLDVLTARGASAMRSEVLAVARELEEAGELERAADAFALAEDPEAEARALAAAGAIERLEERLRDSMSFAREQRERAGVLARIADLDRTAERRAALEAAEGWLARCAVGALTDDPPAPLTASAPPRLAAPISRRQDEQVADAARAIRARLAVGPLIDLEVDGAPGRYALGDEVTVGRGDATIVVASRAVSRTHVRLRRSAAGIEIEDLGTRNGTTLAGAKLAGPLPVRGEVQVLLGGEVPCAITPLAAAGEGPPRPGERAGGCVVEIAGERIVAPLGDLAVGPWRIRRERAGDAWFVVLRTPRGAPPAFLGGYQLSAAVELCFGDAITASRGGPIVLRVPGGQGAAAASGDVSSPGWGRT